MIANEVAQIVDDVLSGRILDRNAFAARVAEIPAPLEARFAGALHLAGHYLDDEDIRRTNGDYARNQRQELVDVLDRLKMTASPAD